MTREVLAVGKCCGVMLLDVTNALDSINWGWIRSTVDELDARKDEGGPYRRQNNIV